jgi:hypothetical protein
MAIATTKIIGTLRDTPIIRGTSIIGGITIVMIGANIIGVIVGTIAMIGRAATAGVIADELMNVSHFTRARIRVA